MGGGVECQGLVTCLLSLSPLSLASLSRLSLSPPNLNPNAINSSLQGVTDSQSALAGTAARCRPSHCEFLVRSQLNRATTFDCGVQATDSQSEEEDAEEEAVPCSVISLDTMDISGEQHLDVSHEVHKHSLSWTPSMVSGGVGHPHAEEGSY